MMVKPIIISPSLLCNNNCIICGGLSSKIEQSFFQNSLLQMLEFLKKKYDEGYNTVWISGGEPTIYPLLLDLILSIKKLGYEKITLFTNGRRLSDKKFIHALIEKGVDGLHISLHGHNAAIHDFITRIKGSFLQTVDGIKNALKFKSVTVSIEHVILKINTPYLMDFAKFILDEFDSERLTAIQFTYPEIHSITQYNTMEILPRFSEIRPYLSVALHNLSLNDIIPIVESIPPCFFLGYEKFYGDHYRSKRSVPSLGYNHISNKTFRYSQILKSDIKVKPQNCKGCIYRKYCKGVYKTYIDLFGEEEFHPIEKRYGQIQGTNY